MNLFVVAGEASADLHGSALIRELRKTGLSFSAFGVGGAHLANEGVQLVVEASRLNVVGFADWFDQSFDLLRAYNKIKRAIACSRIDLAILMDLPDINIRLARKLSARGVPVVYYITPQVWAWRKYRVRYLRQIVSKLLVVFPFERQFFSENGCDVEYVGHPLLDVIHERTEYRSQVDICKAPKVAFLPGSRLSEVVNHAPILREVMKGLRQIYPGCEMVIPVPPTLQVDWVRGHFAGVEVQIEIGNSHDALKNSDFAVVASGTATLEAALTGTPLCLVYRVHPVSAWIFRAVTSYRGFLGLPNILLGEEVIREFVQEKCNASGIVGEARRMIENESYRKQIENKLKNCRAILGGRGASQRVASRIHEMLMPHLLSNPVSG